MTRNIDKSINDVKKVISEEISNLLKYKNNRWKKGYWNQHGVYELKLNISEICRIRDALKKSDSSNKLWGSTYPKIRLKQTFDEIYSSYTNGYFESPHEGNNE